MMRETLAQWKWLAAVVAMGALLAADFAVGESVEEAAEVEIGRVDDSVPEAFVSDIDENGNPIGFIDSQGNPVNGTMTQDVLRVSNANGIHLVVHAEVNNASGEVFQAEGFSLWINFGDGEDPIITDDTFVRISPNGRALLRATYTK